MIKQDSCFCFLPNAFSPDGNQNNEALRPLTKGVNSSGFSFTVRDRKQKILFTSTNVTTPFNSNWDGVNEPEGEYFVTVKGSFECGTSLEEHTRVNLIRNCIPKYLDEEKLIFESMGSFVNHHVAIDAHASNEKKCD